MWLDVAFGAGKASLTTVGYRLYSNTGGDAQARTTTGVVEIGNGAYGVDISSVPSDAVGIEWDTGDAAIEYAIENIRQSVNIKYSNDVQIKGTGTTADPWNPV